MHQFTPNDHLVSTSNWHSFPKDNFWANPDYPNVDFADLHAYATSATDTAENTRYYSELYGAKQPEGAGKPLIRGETGFSDEVVNDTEGIWLHNYATPRALNLRGKNQPLPVANWYVMAGDMAFLVML